MLIYRWIWEGVNPHLNLPIKEQKYWVFVFILELLIWYHFNVDAHYSFVLYGIYVVLEIEKFYDCVPVGDPRNIRILLSQQPLFSIL